MNPKLILLCTLIIFETFIYSAPISEQIIVDQIGYRTNAAKWFMIKNPITGYDSANTYVPGATVQLRRSSDNAVMQTITLTAWNGGATDTTFSGDRVWQGQFTSFTTPGTYHIYDPTNNRQSYNFEIGDNVYNAALAASVKSYFYNRSNIAITSTHGGIWTHSLDHTQQLTARLYDASLGGIQNGTERDITLGWFDAGDYRKYTSWMAPVIWDLAYAYEWYSDRFSDSTGIPESGNGVPDILDEIKWELDWMLKMQETNQSSPRFGALYSGCFVVRGINGTSDGIGNPATDNRPYFYANFSTAATASGAAAFAIGARLFAAFSSAYPGYSSTLLTAAERAWAFLQANPNNIQYNHTNFDNANANQDDNAERRLRFMAAAELYRATGNTIYRTYCDANYNNPNTADGTYQPITSNNFLPGAGDNMKRGLISYCFASGATTSVVNAIRTSVRNGADWYIIGNLNNNPYRAFMWEGHYTWGSNGLIADWGNIAMYAVALNVNPASNAAYRDAAEEYVHYFHGRNPTAFCYLTQSQLFGADKSITQIYHSWFHDGTSWDTNPAPGFLAGGPNRFYAPDPSYGGTIVPPQNQPPMKSYRDWNTSWPQNSWEVTENSTGYQSRHVLLLAAFAGIVATPTNTPTNTPYAGTPTFTRTRTSTPTNTPYFSPTNTFTSTPIPPYTLIYDGDTAGYRLSDGTVNNGSPGTMTETTGGKTGNGMLLTYTSIQGWWQEHWWDKTTNINIGSNTHLVFDVRAVSGSVNQFLVRINWSNNYPNVANYLLEGGVIDTTWKTARIPLSALLETGQTQIDFIDFIANWNANYTVMVDNIRLEGASVSPTNTSTNTHANTVTRTLTHTSTMTATYTRTFTPTNTLTNTSINTATNTSTRTNTRTNTETSTATNTFTATRTGTFTATNTFTTTPTYTATVQKVIVGAIRWDAWTGPQNSIGTQVEKTLSPSQYHFRIPFYGIEYSSNSVNIQCTTQSCVDQEILYASSMCLDYWAFIWYPMSSGLQQALNLYLSSLNKNLINFCLIVEHNNYISQISNAQIVSYMQMPEYQKVMGNRPLIYFFDGSDPNLNASNIASLRTLATGAGLGDPYIVLLRISSDLNRVTSLGMNAWSMYAVSWVGNGATYSTLASTDVGQWNWVGITNGYKFIPHVTSGWDKRPRHDNPVSWEGDPGPNAWVQMPTPLELANHIQGAINWVNNNPSSAESKTVLIYAWNEFDEGGYICPNLSAYGGTERLDAIKNILCARTATPTNIPINTVTFTSTFTFTYTLTQTSTSTSTISYTNTFINTPSNTATFTQTFTITNTQTDTNTPTETVTGSQPPTWTNTDTPTHTNTPTNSNTFTETITLTPTNTNIVTNTMTQIPTNSYTLTFTPSFTQTSTNTQQPTLSFTSTNTTIFSNTFTPTRTFTFTYTPTLTVIPNQTATVLETDEFRFDEIIISYPNPVIANNDIKIRYKIKGEEENISVKIYTVALRLIMEINYPKSQIVKNIDGIREIIIKKEYIKDIAKGIYYLIIVAKDKNSREIKGQIKKIIFLK